jgi:hypothetical protein
MLSREFDRRNFKDKVTIWMISGANFKKGLDSDNKYASNVFFKISYVVPITTSSYSLQALNLPLSTMN